VTWEKPQERKITEFTATLENEDELEEPEKEDDWEEEKELDPDQEPTENPVHKPDAIEADHNETDNDEDFQLNKGENMDALADTPFSGKSTNTAIGMGGGAAGAFGGRRGGRANLVAKGGGRGTQSAVDMGLKWLKNHQDPRTGKWDSDDFQAQCKTNTCSGRGEPWCDAGQTGLALLAFLGAGYTHTTESKYKQTVKSGLRYLQDIQDGEGCFGSRTGHFTYNHCIAALAMAEAYGMTKSLVLKDTAQRGIDFLIKAQNPGLGWRYSVQSGDNDTSVTGWAVMALKSAKVAELSVPSGSFEGAKNWLDSVTDEQYYRTGYLQKGDSGARLQSQVGRFTSVESCTAISIMSRIFMGADRSDPLLRGQGDLLSQNLPRWSPNGGPGGESRIDFYYWYYGTLAMFQLGGDYWKAWNESMKDAIVRNQNKDGDERGSWDPKGAWGRAGGRVYATSVNVLSLEIYYRYERVFK
jgi:hypothetical protein